MVVLEGASFPVLQEDAGHAADGEGIVVAVGGEGAAVERLEQVLFLINFLEDGIHFHAGIAHFTVLDRVVVADHVDIEEVFDLGQGDDGVFREVGGAAQVGVLAGKSHEVHVILRPMLGVMRSQSDDGGRTGGVVVGAGIVHVTAQVAQVIVMGGEDVAGVMFLPFHFGDHVKEGVVLQELMLDVQLYTLCSFDGFRRHPDDGLVHDFFAVGLEELDGGSPGVKQAGVGALPCRMQFGKDAAVLVGEPEVAADEAAGVFGLGQVGEELVGVEVQGVHVVHRELALDAGGILPHGEIDARAELLSIGPHFYVAGEGVDVDGERLERDSIGPGLAEFFLQVLAGLVGAAFGVASALVLCAAQFLDDLFEMRQVLRVCRQREEREENDEQFFHGYLDRYCFRSFSGNFSMA